MSILIGWGRRDFSLDRPVQLYGQLHIRVSEGIHDPLYATALALTSEETGESAVFLTLDLECPHGGIIDAVNERVLALCPDIPKNAVIVSGTHTHGGMNLRKTREKTADGREIYPGEKCRDYVADKAAKAICEAWQNRKPGGIAYGYGYAVVAHSRRSTYLCDMGKKMPNSVAPNGFAIMYGKTNDPDFAGYEAGADHFLNALFTTDSKGNLTGIVANVPCPAQTNEKLILETADYWHYVREDVKRRFGDNIYLLNQCGAGGDTAPRILHYKDAQKRRMALKYGINYDTSVNVRDVRTCDDNYRKCLAEQLDIAERVTDSLLEIWNWAKREIDYRAPLKKRFTVLNMPRRRVTKEEYEGFKAALQNLKFPERKDFETDSEYAAAYDRVNSVKRRNERAVKRFENAKTDTAVPMRMHIVTVGEVAFVTCRFEVYIDFSHRLAARSPFIQTFVMQLSGDEDESYIATNRAIKNKGYSASVFCNQVSAEAGQYWVEESLKILEELAEKSRS